MSVQQAASGEPHRVHDHHVHDHREQHHHAHAHTPEQGDSHSRPLAAAPDREPLVRGAGRGKLLFVDPQSGAAGDMVIAALLDLGVPFEVVREATSALALEGVSVQLSHVFAGAIGASKFDVHVHGQQQERSYAEIKILLDQAGLTSSVRELAQRIFLRLARAESEVHRISLDEVHFHEVGAVDAIVDIVGASACLDYLGAKVMCGVLPLGRGHTTCRHGVIPLPAPATVLCLQGLTTRGSGLAFELVTPTGAAILGSVATPVNSWPEFAPERVGWGAGTRNLPDRPNALRVILGEQGVQLETSSRHAVLECNVDDMSGELAAHVIARLLSEGARDAWATPITMKKGRPGWLLSAVCELGQQFQIGQLLLQESSSIGLRMQEVSRMELPRRMAHVETPYGRIPVKLSGVPGEPSFHRKPEFDALQKAAAEHGVPLRQVAEAAMQAALASAPPETDGQQ